MKESVACVNGFLEQDGTRLIPHYLIKLEILDIIGRCFQILGWKIFSPEWISKGDKSRCVVRFGRFHIFMEKSPPLSRDFLRPPITRGRVVKSNFPRSGQDKWTEVQKIYAISCLAYPLSVRSVPYFKYKTNLLRDWI